jgi:hypothetical protein
MNVVVRLLRCILYGVFFIPTCILTFLWIVIMIPLVTLRTPLVWYFLTTGERLENRLEDEVYDKWFRVVVDRLWEFQWGILFGNWKVLFWVLIGCLAGNSVIQVIIALIGWFK